MTGGVLGVPEKNGGGELVGSASHPLHVNLQAVFVEGGDLRHCSDEGGEQKANVSIRPADLGTVRSPGHSSPLLHPRLVLGPPCPPQVSAPGPGLRVNNDCVSIQYIGRT